MPYDAGLAERIRGVLRDLPGLARHADAPVLESNTHRDAFAQQHPQKGLAMHALLPSHPVPALNVALAGGGSQVLVVFLVPPDGTLYYGAVQTMPFARRQFQDLMGAIDFAIAKDYPACGEFTGEV